ncbi:MAG: HAD family hydrolase [Candidatus Promineifilaceae bacterium]
MPERRAIEAVIFDLDDTLIDWSAPAVEWAEHAAIKTGNIYRHLAEAGHSLPAPAEFGLIIEEAVHDTWLAARRDWTMPSMAEVFARIFEEMGLDAGRIEIEQVLRAYGWGAFPGVVPFAETRPLLEALRERGYRLGLVTNSFMPMWMRDIELRAYGLLEFFDARLTSGDAGYLKPHPAIFERIVELLGTASERAVFVGDRPATDIAGANQAGLHSVLFVPPHLVRDLNGVRPEFTIYDLCDLLLALEALEGQTP